MPLSTVLRPVTDRGVRLDITIADIAALEDDAIVNAANASLPGGSRSRCGVECKRVDECDRLLASCYRASTALRR